MLRVFIFLVLLFPVTCWGKDSKVLYTNSDFGLTLQYSSSWELIDQPRTRQLLAPLSETSSEVRDSTKVIQNVIFRISKPQKINGKSHNATFSIAAFPVSSDECSYINSSTYASDNLRNNLSTLPGAKPSPTLHPKPLSRISGYTTSAPRGDRVALQHRYFYCRKLHYIIIQGTSSTPSGRADLAKVISTIRVAGL